MYTATYAGEVLHDPRDESRTALDQSCTVSLTEAGSYTFTLPKTHPLAGRLEVMARSKEVVLSEDGAEIFRGRVRRVPEQGMEGSWEYECEGERAYLNDVCLPPYECGAAGVPTGADGLFAWFVSEYDRKVPEADRFHVGVNEGWKLCPDELTESNDSRPQVWAEMKSKLIEPYGGYIRVRHEGGLRWIDWLADGTRECAQRVEFGVNLTDYALERDGSELYTRIVPWARHENEDREDTGGEEGDGSELRISKQPADVWASAGEDASFSVSIAGGDGTYGYEWHTSAGAGQAWAACGDGDGEGHDTGQLKVTAEAALDGHLYRCRVWDASGAVALSEAAVLRVTDHPEWFGIEEAEDRPLLEGYEKLGDAVVDVGAEQRHGVIEKAVEYEAADAAELVTLALQDLVNAGVAETLEVSAVDLHRVDPAVERIALGDFVRVTSEPHGFDAYMLCTSIDVDPSDATATYTLGTPTDTLTGAQTDRLSALNEKVGRQAELATAATEAAERAGRAATSAGDRADAAERTAGETASKAVVRSTREYATSAAPETAPTDGWSTEAPAYAAGAYVWERSQVEYGSGATETTGAVLVTGPQGEEGADGRGVAEIEPQYYASDSATEPTGGEWSASSPSLEGGKTAFERQRTVWSDGTEEYSQAVPFTALNDVNGKVEDVRTLVSYDSEGLHVGKTVDGAQTSTNVLVDDTGLAVRDSAGTVLSSFGAAEASLGADSTTARIDLCGGVASIQGSTNGGGDGVTMRSQWVGVQGTSAVTMLAHGGTGADAVSASVGAGYPDAGSVGDMRVSLYAASGQSADTVSMLTVWPDYIYMKTATLKLGGTECPMTRAQHHLAYDVYTGTTAIQVTGVSAVLWTAEEFEAAFGAAYDQGKTYIGLMNGDVAATNVCMTAGYRSTDGAVLALFDAELSGKWVRVNYIVFA